MSVHTGIWYFKNLKLQALQKLLYVQIIKTFHKVMGFSRILQTEN